MDYKEFSKLQFPLNHGPTLSKLPKFKKLNQLITSPVPQPKLLVDGKLLTPTNSLNLTAIS